MPLENNWFLKHTPAEIVAMVSTLTLATISTWTDEELQRVGWDRSSTVRELYTQTSAGVWIAQRNATGLLTEANSSVISGRILSTLYAAQQSRGVVAAISGDDTVLRNAASRIATLSFTTDAAGNAAAQPLHTAAGAYYPVVKLMWIHGTITAANMRLTITVTGGARVGPEIIEIPLTAYRPLEIPGQLELWNLTDASVISVSVSGGGNTSTINLGYQYWSET